MKWFFFKKLVTLPISLQLLVFPVSILHFHGLLILSSVCLSLGFTGDICVFSLTLGIFHVQLEAEAVHRAITIANRVSMMYLSVDVFKMMLKLLTLSVFVHFKCKLDFFFYSSY